MAVCGLHKCVEWVSGGHVGEMRAVRSIGGPPFAEHHYLAQLPPGNIGSPPEGTICVTGNDTLVVCGFHECIEWAGSGHVGEMRAACNIRGPALCQHHYLAQLPPGNLVVRAEGIVRVTGYHIPAIEIA